MNTIGEMLLAALKDQGIELGKQGRVLQAYAAARASHLATLVGQKGFDYALRAETDSVALEAARLAVSEADATDARLLGIVQAVLSIGLRLPPAA